MKTELSQRASVWTRYWLSGAMHSCAGSYDADYAGPIGDYWRTGFATLRLGARTLDLASGNGPLPRLLLSLNDRPDLRCDAVDLADVAPAWLDELPASARERVQFHSACAAESLPFADDCFDLVVSQWGLEYSELSRSIPELLRVLAPGGGVQLLLHHQEALPVRLAAEELAHIAWLTEPEGFMEQASAMLGPMAQAGTADGRRRLMSDASANRVREQFNTRLELLESRAEQGACVDVLLELRQGMNQLLCLAAQRGEAVARAGWHGLHTALQDTRLRLEELRRHSLDEAGAVALALRLARGAPYRLAPMLDRGAVMGWALTVTPQR